MIEGREHFRLALKPHHAIGIARKRLRQNLNRHIALQPRLACAEDLTHTSGADR
jgi:hypothetical protein